MTDIYLRLDYRQYKHLEAQLRDYQSCETVHTTVTGFYHKALRLDIGDVTLEIQGPSVKEPIEEPLPTVQALCAGHSPMCTCYGCEQLREVKL